jgi:hypothetical protein
MAGMSIGENCERNVTPSAQIFRDLRAAQATEEHHATPLTRIGRPPLLKVHFYYNALRPRRPACSEIPNDSVTSVG